MKDLADYDIEPSDRDATVVRTIQAGLSILQPMLNNHLSAADTELCKENGSTLCLGLQYQKYLLCCNVGDSSMMAFDRKTGKPLKIWKREGLDANPDICSYEDTLAYYPQQVREGQSMQAVGKDFEAIHKNCRTVTNYYGFKYYPVSSPLSPYGLAMTNTLGNMNHYGRTFTRTTVYIYSIPEILSLTNDNKITFCFVTDGVKDVMTSSHIGQMFSSIENGLLSLSQLEGPALSIFGIDQIIDRAAVSQFSGTEDAPAVNKRLPNFAPFSPVHLDRMGSRSKEEIKQLIFDTADQDIPSLHDACKAIVHTAILRNSHDDVTCLAVEVELLDDQDDVSEKEKENVGSGLVSEMTGSAKKRVLLDAVVEGRSMNLCETIMLTAKDMTEDEEEEGDENRKVGLLMNDEDSRDEAVVVCSEEELVLPVMSEPQPIAPAATPVTSQLSCPTTPLKRADGMAELKIDESLVGSTKKPKVAN